MLRLLPSATSLIMLTRPRKIPQLRMDMDEPRCRWLTSEAPPCGAPAIRPPMRRPPFIDRPEPTRAKLRQLIVLPQWNLSKTLQRPLTREELRTDKDDPRWQKLITDAL